MPDTPFAGRPLRLCYWAADSRIVDSERASLEGHLARIGDARVVPIKALDSPDAKPCDLLIVAAQKIVQPDFAAWLSAFRRRVAREGDIWTPALILADVPFDVLSEIWPEARADNWYFDILSPTHLSSLPIRVANLLRIHDHLHEMKRYASALEDIGAKVANLERELETIRKSGGGA